MLHGARPRRFAFAGGRVGAAVGAQLSDAMGGGAGRRGRAPPAEGATMSSQTQQFPSQQQGFPGRTGEMQPTSG